MEQHLGKIRSASFGLGGYQDAMLGFTFVLEASGASWCDFWGVFPPNEERVTPSVNQQRITALGEATLKVYALLAGAKAQRLDQLAGKPIEITEEGQRLASWRILTEVL